MVCRAMHSPSPLAAVAVLAWGKSMERCVPHGDELIDLEGRFLRGGIEEQRSMGIPILSVSHSKRLVGNRS
jgi:hypothetical protein